MSTRRSNKFSAMQNDPEVGNNKMAKGEWNVYIGTSAQRYNVEWLINFIIGLYPYLCVRYLALPYNDLDKFILPDDADIIILCHSINNRRFAVTDVLDAIYDKFLPYAMGLLGKQRVGVIVHDFPSNKLDTDEKYKVEMDAFRHKQPTAFQCSNLTMITGKLSVQPSELESRIRSEIERFLVAAANYRAQMTMLIKLMWGLLCMFLLIAIILMCRRGAGILTIMAFWVVPVGYMGFLIAKAMRNYKAGAWKNRLWTAKKWRLAVCSIFILQIIYFMFFPVSVRITINVCSPSKEYSMEPFVRELSVEYPYLGEFKACTLRYKEDFPGGSNEHDITILAHSFKYGGYDLPQVEDDILANMDNVYKGKERTVVMIYDMSYGKVDTGEEYRQEMREFQKAEPMVAKTSKLTLLTVELDKIFNLQSDIIEDFKEMVENFSKGW